MAAARPGPSLAHRPSMSCRVLRVYSHVLLRYVAAPSQGVAARQAHCRDDLNLRLLEYAPHRSQVDVDARAPLENDKTSDAQVQLVQRKLRAAVTERADDTAPVGVAAVHGALDKARRRDCAGRGPRLCIRLRALDADRDHPGRTLTVTSDCPRQLPCDADDGRLQRFRFGGAL